MKIIIGPENLHYKNVLAGSTYNDYTKVAKSSRTKLKNEL